jgi:NhaA family Na+:H+ antiporter
VNKKMKNIQKIIPKIVPAAIVPVNRVVVSLRNFLRLEASGGLMLMAAAALALIIANSAWESQYNTLLNIPIEIRVGALMIAKPMILWINDGLMAVFFFLVGLELKREIIEGHLSSLKLASLPAAAAIGGMIAPALLYSAFNQNDAQAMSGWAIPTATDIAFALGVLALLGNRVPTALKAFLLSVAIFDDLGAVIVIALFYTSQLSTTALSIAAFCIAILFILNQTGVKKSGAYILVGIVLWVAVLKSGVHATLAGVVLAMFIPIKLDAKSAANSDKETSLLHQLEHSLHPWIAYGVLPIFAFANAGVSLTGLSMTDALHPVPLGIIVGLFFGKQIGIMLLCWIATMLKIASLPEGVNWKQLYGVALLCGIGFTMSLFIASLAFEQGVTDYFGLERLGILIGTLISGIAGYFVLRMTLPKEAAN